MKGENMRAYGLPRNHDVEFPDAADICFYALKSSIGSFPKKNGRDYPSSHRTSHTKRNFRRVWKRKARIEGKNEILNSINE